MFNKINIKSRIVMLVTGFVVSIGSAAAYESFHGPTELIYSNPDKAASGYMLFSTLHQLEEHQYTYLVDIDGNLVHKWKTITPDYEGRSFTMEKTARLTETGSIIQGLSTDRHAYRGERALQELDWDGNLIWDFSDPREGYRYHHNFKRVWNNHLNDWTIIFISRMPMTQERAVEAGADPAVEWDAAPDGVVEVDMNGNIVWQWWSLDHVVQDQNLAWPNYGELADNPGKINLNWGKGLSGDFIHQNALDYNQELDQIIVNNDSMGEVLVIDHGGTFVRGDFEASKALAAGSKGDVLYRWGNPSLYNSGEAPSYKASGNVASDGDQRLFHHHDSQWIKEGLPGAGNFLIFQNGSRHPGTHQSQLLEVNPYKGTYPDSEYLSELEADDQVIWSFKARQPNSFSSYNISGVQRLSNGNTFALAGRHGHAFQVTPEGEVVWEYIVPVMTTLPEDPQLKDIYKTNVSDADDHSVFTAHWISTDHPGLVGKDLTPQGKITDILKE
jgi:hypothetical protein